MLNKNDLRGIVTIVMLAIFICAIFVPVLITVLAMVDVVIPETYTQAVIQLTTMVVTFYFTNKATRDKMTGEYYYTRNGYAEKEKGHTEEITSE